MGIGPNDPRRNPLAAADLPRLEGLLAGGRPLADHLAEGPVTDGLARLSSIDACLGVEGRPQSGTGQTALLTGLNAPSILGRHFGPWVPTDLREMLRRENLLSRLRRADLPVGFANAYPARFVDQPAAAARRPGAFPLAARSAEVLSRTEADLRRGDALASSISTERWREHVDPSAPLVTPESAAATLAGISGRHALTVFAHYDTDLVGHARDLAAGVHAIERLDAFVGALVDHIDERTLVVMTSDHGNLEDVQSGHTRNPVPLLAVGRGAASFTSGVRSIMDVAPLILEILGAADGRGEGSGPEAT